MPDNEYRLEYHFDGPVAVTIRQGGVTIQTAEGRTLIADFYDRFNPHIRVEED